MRDHFPRLRYLCLGALLSLVASAAPGQPNQMSLGQRNLACGSPVSLDDGWDTASPESVGMDGARLCGIAARLQLTGSQVHSVVVARHGKLVFEQYFQGMDQPWGEKEAPHEFTPTTRHDMRSASKSVVSLLVGIAIDRKLIAGADEPVVKFFSEYRAVKQAGWDTITLRHLLTMSSGIKWDETLAWSDPNNDEPHLAFDADPLGYVLSKPVVASPDILWVYNGGGTDLLGNILERASGKTLAEFAGEALFGPIGITDFEWKNYPKNGKIAAAAGLRLRPRDAAKLGQLVLGRGMWNGKQIVSADWIEKSTAPRFQAAGYFGGTLFYGYQWWMGRSLSDGKEVKWVAAFGWGGQRIVIVPDLDLVMMTTAAQYGKPKEGLAAMDILANVVIPSVRDAR
jgi:CubicO group peptidase (beta-lactamase class C family)